MNIKRNIHLTIRYGLILITATLITAGCSQATEAIPIPLPSPTTVVPTPLPPTEIPEPTAIPPTPTPDLVSLVMAFEQAYNNHDLEAIKPMFTDMPMYQWLGFFYLGKDEVFANMDAYFGLNSQITNTDCVTNGKTVTCQAVEVDDIFTGAGIGEFHFTSVAYTIEDGKISKFVPTALAEDFNQWWTFCRKLHLWALDNQPEMFEKSGFDCHEDTRPKTREQGEILSDLVKAYTAANPQP